MVLKTALWHIKKEKLLNGPTFPNTFMDMQVYHLCTATLNRSHVMLTGYSIGNDFRTVVIFDFIEKLWYSISDLQLENNLNLDYCRASATIDKSGKK